MTTPLPPARLDLLEATVVLVGNANNPTILNQDFLTLNGIVDSQDELQEPVIVTPAFAQISYRGGLRVTADPQRIVFSQSGDSLLEGDVRVPAMALAYVRCVPHVRYQAIGLNFTVHGCTDAEIAPSVFEQVTDHPRRWMFCGREPTVQFKAIYGLEDCQLSVEVSDLDGFKRATRFHGNFHRQLEPDIHPTARISRIKGTVDAWDSDLRRMRDFVAMFFGDSR